MRNQVDTSSELSGKKGIAISKKAYIRLANKVRAIIENEKTPL